ncbi:hypothetical protein HK102_002724 [Quaeritorhiza haematococci]|nr:hypothetical protein HK102_002724 [Quaeritorhiza haematococci]
MGLLSLGTPLPWSEAKKHADHVRKHGIIQFLNIWNRVKTRRKDHLLWGDEVEYMVVYYDEDTKSAKLSLKAHDALEKLHILEREAKEKGERSQSIWHPEYGRFMLEATPGSPYGATLKDLLFVEPSMKDRRNLALGMLRPNEALITVTSFPLLGAEDFLEPHTEPTPDKGASMSLFVPDEAINPHARFPTLTANIRQRRGCKVAINVPIFKDKNTPSPFLEPAPKSLQQFRDSPEKLQQCAAMASSLNAEKNIGQEGEKGKDQMPSLPELIPDALPDHIYMDCMAFGMGCSCLQVTFQACSVEEARSLYDQLAVLCPIMMALTAAAPIFRGYLADVECRWDVISGSVDDRTKEERSLEPLKSSRFRIPKSRYGSISLYLSSGPSYSGGCPGRIRTDYYKPEYNDLEVPYDEQIYRDLLEGGVDELLAKHYSHLFIRDPLVVFEELLEQDDTKSSDHFENIQSTNWQTMRFKPPPPNTPHIGWRVEFRPMEIQPTDTENAAFAVFIVLLTRTILSFDLNLYIPLSRVDENMKKGQKRGAVLEEKFWFRKNLFGSKPRPNASTQETSSTQHSASTTTPTPTTTTAAEDKGDGNMSVANGILPHSSAKAEDRPCCPDEVVNGRWGPPPPPQFTASREGEGASSSGGTNGIGGSEEDEYELMTINEIINGKGTSFPGLGPLVSSYISATNVPHEVSSKLQSYVDLVCKRASGELPTTAAWMRNFVRSHPKYQFDSVVGKDITWDLVKELERLGRENAAVGSL